MSASRYAVVLSGDEARAAVLASRLATWQARLDYARSVNDSARIAECERALSDLRVKS